MFRLVVIEVLLFLLPFAVYLGATWLRRQVTTPVSEEVAVPVIRLGVVGLVLVSVSLIVLAFVGGSPADGHYVPERFENGRLIPGYIK